MAAAMGVVSPDSQAEGIAKENELAKLQAAAQDQTEKTAN
jgi:hypothetical protein